MDAVKPKSLSEKPSFEFALPSTLLEAIVGLAGEDRFDARRLAAERQLSRECAGLTMTVGRFGSQGLTYGLLRDLEPLASFLSRIPREYLEKELGWPPGVGTNLAGNQEVDRILNWARTVSRGYAGWLCSNAQFIQEHDTLLKQHPPMSTSGRFESSISAHPEREKVSEHDVVDQRQQEVEAFLHRWHLTALAGPYLPEPVGMQFPALPSNSALVSSLGTYVFLPMIWPLPERDVLRQLVENAIGRSQAPEHLKEWVDLVEKDTQSKKKIDVFARRFVLQHFWHVLLLRYGDILRRQEGKALKLVAIHIFGAGADEADAQTRQLQEDLTFLTKARGDGWERRPFLTE